MHRARFPAAYPFEFPPRVFFPVVSRRIESRWKLISCLCGSTSLPPQWQTSGSGSRDGIEYLTSRFERSVVGFSNSQIRSDDSSHNKIVSNVRSNLIDETKRYWKIILTMYHLIQKIFETLEFYRRMIFGVTKILFA